MGNMMIDHGICENLGAPFLFLDELIWGMSTSDLAKQFLIANDNDISLFMSRQPGLFGPRWTLWHSSFSTKVKQKWTCFCSWMILMEVDDGRFPPNTSISYVLENVYC